MMMLIAAAVAAAQPAPAAAITPPADAHAQHQQTGHEGMMSEKEMADCQKCCEEMMAKKHKGHAEHKGQKAQ
jgi:hypothetical protein